MPSPPRFGRFALRFLLWCPTIRQALQGHEKGLTREQNRRPAMYCREHLEEMLGYAPEEQSGFRRLGRAERAPGGEINCPRLTPPSQGRQDDKTSWGRGTRPRGASCAAGRGPGPAPRGARAFLAAPPCGRGTGRPPEVPANLGGQALPQEIHRSLASRWPRSLRPHGTPAWRPAFRLRGFSEVR